MAEKHCKMNTHSHCYMSFTILKGLLAYPDTMRRLVLVLYEEHIEWECIVGEPSTEDVFFVQSESTSLFSTCEEPFP